MAEYRVEFTADSGSAERSIKNLKKEIKDVTKEFESAEIGAGDFIEAASNLSGLQKELKDARREVVDIDGAYKTLSQTMAQFRSGMGARGAISSVASPIRGGAQQFGSPAYFDALNKDLEQAIKEGRQLDTEIQRAAESREQAIANFRTGMGARGASQVASSVQGTPQQFGSPAYFDALNKSLRMAIDEGRQLDAEIKRAAESREQAIMEFRAGMGARGAIPAVASPVRGGIEYGPAYGSAGSPAYLEEVARAAKKAQQELDEAAKAAGTIAPPVKAFNPASLAAYEAKLKILKAEARLILPDSKRWKELNKEILKLERGVERINKKQRLGPSARQRAGAAGGAFLYGGGMGGGPGSAVGGIAGGLMGGVPGAFTGAAIGQAVDSLGGALAGITSQAAAVQQLQRGLALASIDAKDFAEAQSAVADVSSRLFIPLEQVTKSFAQLRVNTKQYGLSVEETKQILEGTILAVSAFGGSAEDVDGAMRAVVQILSKGSVQAEELRGQLGERFPGAVIKFAQANKLSFDELQDRLKEGTIGIKEFVTFAKDNYEDYAEFSKTISTAPEFAGRRLAKALEEMQMVIGQVFGSSGATIQDFSSQALKDITKFIVDNKELLAQLAKDFAVVFAGIMSVVAEAGKFIIKVLAPVLSYIGSVIRQLRVMTGAADAATAKAEMDAANVIIQRTGMGRDAYLSGQPRPRSFADKIEFDAAQERYKRAEERFKAAGGKAALPPETGTPPNLVFGGAGAGVSMDAAAKEDKENKKKTDNLESFERLRDQLANAYNQAEIERIKSEYELRKRLQEDIYDMQEFGANRLQKQNLQFLRALAKAEQDRQDTLMDAQLKVAEAAGRIAPSAPMLPSAGGAGAGSLPGSISGRLDASGQNGADMPVALNNIMRSYHNGIVTEINRAGNNGNYVVVEFLDDLGNKLEATYSHVAAAVKVGQSIVGGQTIGRFDASGRTFGAHNSVDINTPGTNGALQRNQEGAAARRSADLLVTGRVQGSVGAGAPRRIGSNESRDTMAGASVEIAQQNAAISERGGLLTKESTILKELGRYMQEMYNVPDLTLDNQLLKARNDLLDQGVDENVIDYKMRLLELDIQYQHLVKAFPKFADRAKLSTEERKQVEAELAKGLAASKDAEKAKNEQTLRGIEIGKKRERDKYIKSLQEEIKLLLIVSDEERRLAELRTQYGGDAMKLQEVFNLEEIKKNIEATRALIDDFVSSTTGDYKGFLKAILSGENAADALKQLQASLKDKVLTIFLDFAMAPIEKSLKEGLFSFFKPKVDPKLLEQEKSVNALTANTTELKNLTTAIKGIGASTAPSVPAAPAATTEPIALPVVPFDPNAVTAPVAAASKELNTALSTNITGAIQDVTKQANTEGPKFSESLGKTVGAIGIAAGSIMGIAAGLSQIKEGGTSNVLGGIGSVLMSLGGAVGGFAGFFKGANGGVAGGGWKPFPVAAFANGGMVTGPTLGLVGEGKYNEAIVPLPDGRSIPVQMKGASGGGLREAMSGNNGKASGSPILNMSFQSTNINGVEYVSRDQLEAAMATTRKQAAKDGANRGMSMTLDKLQQSPQTRNRLGMR
jgi:tape measure domain-containing protein